VKQYVYKGGSEEEPSNLKLESGEVNLRKLTRDVLLLVCIVAISTLAVPARAASYPSTGPDCLRFVTYPISQAQPYSSFTVYSFLGIFPFTWSGEIIVRCDSSAFTNDLFGGGFSVVNGPDPAARYLIVYVRGQFYASYVVHPGQDNDIPITVSLGWFDSAVVSFYIFLGSWYGFYCYSGYSNWYSAGTYYNGWYVAAW
jgi:hypothetical protein